MAPQIWPGRMVCSLAGHDKGSLYIVIGEENGLFLLSDGRLKPLSAPKRKKAMHFQPGPVTELASRFGKGETVRDEDIRRVLKEARKAGKEAGSDFTSASFYQED